MGNLYKLYCLEPVDRSIVLQIFIALPLVALGLRLFGFTRLFLALEHLAEQIAETPLENESIRVERVRRWVSLAKRKAPYPGNCLSRSLVLWWLLRRQQIECVIRIGTRKQNGELQAHAWVEYQGLPLNGGEQVQQQYSMFDYAFVPETLQIP